MTQTSYQYVLDFGEDFVLEPGQSIILDYGADIDLSLPSTVINLNATGTIGSGYQLPLTLDNPTGMSYIQAPGDNSDVISDGEIVMSLLRMLPEMKLTEANSNT